MAMLTVDDIKSEGKLYLVNGADGDVNILLRSQDGSGKADLVTIPKTWVPIRATDFAEINMFKKSTEFRRLVMSGLVKIVSEAEAEKILNSPDGAKEQERVRKKCFSNAQFGGTDQDSEPVNPIEIINSAGNDDVSLVVKDIIIRDDIDDDEKITLLINEYNRNQMTTRDLEFVMTTLEKNSKIYKWAEEKISNGEKLFKRG